MIKAYVRLGLTCIISYGTVVYSTEVFFQQLFQVTIH